jgi:hypothetical protein
MAQQKRRVREFSSAPPEGAEPPKRNPLEGIEFTLDKVAFKCNGRLDLLDISELSMLAVSGTDVRSPQGLAMIAQFLQIAFGPLEYMRFRMHVREHDTHEDTVFQIVQEISEAIGIFTEGETGRPTGPPSSSSPGEPDRAEQISRVISLGTGDVTLVDQVPGR